MALSGGSIGAVTGGQSPNPFAQFGRSPSPNPAANPFASTSQQPQPTSNPFAPSNPFGAPSAPTSNVFGQLSGTSSNHTSPFAAQNQNGDAQQSPFAKQPVASNAPVFGSASAGFPSTGFESTGFGSNAGAAQGFGSSSNNGVFGGPGSQGNRPDIAPFSHSSPGMPFGSRSNSPFASTAAPTNGVSFSPFGKPSSAAVGQKTSNGLQGNSASFGGFGNGAGNHRGGGLNGVSKNRKPNFTETLHSKGYYVVASATGEYQVTRNKPEDADAWATKSNDAHHNPFRALSEQQADPATAVASRKGRVARFTAAAPVATLEEFSNAVNNQLKKDRVKDIALPRDFFEPAKRHKAQAFREAHLEAHKNKVRESLEKGNLLDVYEKQINLEDAIDFRGTCDYMCPLYEIIIRVAEGISQLEEKEESADGTLWPARDKFIKRHARSSAGDKPPLPSEVRTLSALERTTNYLLDDILQGEHNLRDRHAFLWDRLRAVRRDFIFYTRMRPEETLMMVDILETIARFHAVSHHLLAKKDAANTEYSAKQEQEAFQKTLISLKQAYVDLNKQGIQCKNEPEFMAYWILFFAQDPSTIRRLDNEMLHKNWSKSHQVQTAISLVNARLDFRTPLQKGQKTPRQKPYEYFPSLAFVEATAYFDIVADPSVSYTMGCVAEMSFTMVRDRLLNTIIQACARSRDSPKDFTPAALREILRFDTESETVEFLEGRGLNFSDDGSYLSLTDKSQRVIESAVPTFSQGLVERKRCDRPLLEVIRNNVYETDAPPPDTVEPSVLDSPEGMFVEDFPGSKLQSFEETAASSVAPSPFAPQQPQRPAASQFQGLPSQQSKPGKPLFGSSAPAHPLGPSQGNSIKFPSTENIPKTNPFASLNKTVDAGKTAGPPLSIFAPGPPKTAEPPAAKQPPPKFQVTPPTPKPQSTTFAKPTNGLSFGTPASSSSGQSAPPSTLFGATANSSGSTPTLGIKQTATPEPSTKPTVSALPSGTGLFQQQPQAQGSAPLSAIQEIVASTAGGEGADDKAMTKSLETSQVQPAAKRPTPTATPAMPKAKPIEGLTKWYVLGDGGMLEEFRDSFVAHLVGEVFRRHQEEERERIKKEQDEKSWAEARKWRTYNLGLKYFYRWRENARNRALSRRAREGREAVKAYRASQLAKAKEERQAMEKRKRKEEALRESRRSSGASGFVEDLWMRQSQRRNSSRYSMDQFGGRGDSSVSGEAVSISDLTNNLNGVRNERQETPAKTGDDVSDTDSVAEALLGPRGTIPSPGSAESKRSSMLRSWKDSLSRSASLVKESAMAVFSSSAKDAARRGSFGTEDEVQSQMSRPLSRTSSLSRSLPAKNRLTNFSGVTKKRAASPASQEQRFKVPRSSGLRTSHFRLRAMGMVHMPNGQYLHESIARPLLEGKRFHGIGDYGLSAVEKKLDSGYQGGGGDDDDDGVAVATTAEHQQQRQQRQHGSRLSTSSTSRAMAASPASVHKRKMSDMHADEDWDARSVQSLDAAASSTAAGKKQRTRVDLQETERIIREMRETVALMEEGETWYREQSAAFERGESPWAAN